MMFNKDNTNFNGECLCKSCTFGAPVYNRQEGKPTETYLCLMDTKDHKNVGVCKYYDEFKKDS